MCVFTLQPASRHGLTGLYLGTGLTNSGSLASFSVPSLRLALSILVLMKRQIAYSTVGDTQSALSGEVCTVYSRYC